MKFFFKNKKQSNLTNKDVTKFLEYVDTTIKINKEIKQNFEKINPNKIIKDVIDYEFSISKIKKIITNMQKELDDMKYLKNKIEEDYLNFEKFNEEIKIKIKNIKKINIYKTKLQKKENELNKKEKKINKILDNFIL